jgi:hypothetical protein
LTCWPTHLHNEINALESQMQLLKLADEIYELQGWEPPAKKPPQVTAAGNSAAPSAATRETAGTGSNPRKGRTG